MIYKVNVELLLNGSSLKGKDERNISSQVRIQLVQWWWYGWLSYHCFKNNSICFQGVWINCGGQNKMGHILMGYWDGLLTEVTFQQAYEETEFYRYAVREVKGQELESLHLFFEKYKAVLVCWDVKLQRNILTCFINMNYFPPPIVNTQARMLWLN